MSVSFLVFQLACHFKIGEMKAAELVSTMVNTSERMIREWHKISLRTKVKSRKVHRESISVQVFSGLMMISMENPQNTSV